MLTLNAEIWDELWSDAEDRGRVECPDTDIETIDRAILDRVGTIWQCHTPLQDGLAMEIQNIEVAEDLHLLPEEGEECAGAGMAFFLSGKVVTDLPGLTGEIPEIVGHNYLENSAGIAETETWFTGEPFTRVRILLDPHQLFGDLTPVRQAELPSELQHALAGKNRPYHRQSATTPEMYQILQQILYCPYQGLLKRIYLQGKAWELMTLQFQQFQLDGQQLGRLSAREIEQIYHAKDLLIRQLDRPPSVLNLAKQAGLNDFALKRGFRQVFGTTVFKYLHDYRLEMARQLLNDRDLSIQQIVEQVGFGNRGYFAAAFRKKFGTNPNIYRSRSVP
jgi:AraC family transcriptional regulator, transcriptional activator of the genes for pyochelin and ferripyochelin receptors